MIEGSDCGGRSALARRRGLRVTLALSRRRIVPPRHRVALATRDLGTVASGNGEGPLGVSVRGALPWPRVLDSPLPANRMPRLTMRLRTRRCDLLADSLGRQPLRRHTQFSIAPKGNLDVDCRCPVSPIRSSTAPAPLASRTQVAPTSRPSGCSSIPVARSGSNGGSPSR